MPRNTVIHQKRKEKKRAERKKLGVFAGIGLGVCALLIGLLAWGSHHPSVSISSVEVEGAKVVDVDAVANVVYEELEGNNAFIWNRANMVWYPKDDIIARILKEFPRIKTVSVHRNSTTKITIEIIERAPAYVWCDGSYLEYEQDAALVGETYQPTCYFADREGFIFDSAPVFSGALFVTWFGGVSADNPLGARVREEETFTRALAVMDMMRTLGLSPTQYEFRGDDGYVFFEHGGYIVYPLSVSSEVLHTDLVAVLESLGESMDWEYLDMRFGNKVFFKEKEEGENVE
jgi:hypothetical protein